MPVTQVIHKSYPGMHSVLDIVLTGIETKLGEQVCSEVYQQVGRLEQILSCHLPGAEVYELNRKAITDYVSVSFPLFNILLESRQYHRITRGYFDIGLKKLKNNDRFDQAVPVGMDTIEIDERKQKVRFWSENTAIDMGGLGKGLLLREAGKIFANYSITNCFVSFGGSSILTRGTHPHGNGWPVSVRDISGFTFYLNDHAASFSESHQETDDQPHIIHPRTFKYAENRRLTFIQATCPVLAEVLSTALVVAPVEETGQIVSSSEAIKAFVINKTDHHNFTIEYQYGN